MSILSQSASPWLNSFYPIRIPQLHLRKKLPTLSLPKTTQSHHNLSSLALPQTHTSSSTNHITTHPYQDHSFILQFHSSADNNEDPEPEIPKQEQGVFTNMWWADLKAALGQRLNFGAIVFSAGVLLKDRHLALPHVYVRDIRCIDWAELRRRGFQGVVFDKDNTITAPYSLALWPPLAPSIQHCKSVFGSNIAVFSNSAGLYEYDHDGSKARELEGAIGIKVIRHRVKKPAGASEEIEKHFGCESSQLIMVGDRPLTDIVYGNINGFLTILTEPLSLAEEPFIVRQVRKLETSLVKRWSRRGLNPTSHRLLPDTSQCVIDPPIS
ncbi:hypothetical protein UlMin_015040 [Ulmus minor]